MSRGFLIYAHNNRQIDYGLIAMANARMIKSVMPGSRVAVVTDAGTLDWLKTSRGQPALQQAFDEIITVPSEAAQSRRVHDTISTEHTVEWRNRSRVSAYQITPFDETILLDCDYLVQDRSLELCWGSASEVRMNRDIRLLTYTEPALSDRRVDAVGIPLYWATAVYFRRGEVSETLFGMVEHVRENYEYYRFLYDLPGPLYRNDFAFSIAAHVMNGYYENGGTIEPLPCPFLLTSKDRDDIVDVDRGSILFLVNDADDSWRFRPSRVERVNVHVMNKFAVVRHAEKLLEVYQ